MDEGIRRSDKKQSGQPEIRVCPHCGASKQRRYAGGVPLNRSKPRGSRPCGASRKEEKENTTMTKTMNIEGMMCMHCEATVKKALEKLEGVTEAKVSHEAGTAVVEMSTEVADDVLKKAVEDKDYTVTGIA